MSHLKLFCFPYAGGSSSVYSKWKKHLLSSIELCTIELAGRGSRFDVPYYNSIEDAAEDIFEKLIERIDDSPYALFGHSMGTVIIYELVNKIAKRNVKMPLHLFLSGRNPPDIKSKEKYLHNLPDYEFKSEILKLGGTPKELFEHPELLNIFMPVLKSDYKIVETYNPKAEFMKWDINISVLNGTEDDIVDVSSAFEWGKYTSQNCYIHNFEGGHFFIHDNMEDVVHLINSTLTGYMGKIREQYITF